jgi:hypothetical protein
MDEDIFTLARDKGAVSAVRTFYNMTSGLWLPYLFQLLYSLYSLACVINPQYSDPQSYDQVFDIFSTQSLTSSHLIEYQFGQLTPQNESLFAYDSQQLNDSASNILQSLNLSHPIAPGYLLAFLRAHNATDPGGDNTDSGESTRSTSATSNDSPNTALAMFVLLVFCLTFRASDRVQDCSVCNNGLCGSIILYRYHFWSKFAYFYFRSFFNLPLTFRRLEPFATLRDMGLEHTRAITEHHRAVQGG